MVAAAVIGGAVVGSVAGGVITSQGAQNAADTTANAATQNQQSVLAAGQQASNLDLNALAPANAVLQPYVNLGQTGAMTVNNALTGANNGQMLQALQQMPGYQFQLQQGLEAAQNGFAAKGIGSSGAAMKGAADYANGLAASNYQNYFNNALTAAGLGANAASLQSQNIANLNTAAGNALFGGATNAASLGLAGANAVAAGQAASANAIGNGIANAGNSLSQYALLQGLQGNGLSGAASASPLYGYSSGGAVAN